jgi:hypothetical protein
MGCSKGNTTSTKKSHQRKDMAIVAAILRLRLFIPYVPSRNLKNSLVAFCVRLKNFHLHIQPYGKRESFPSLQSVCWYVPTSYVSVQIVQVTKREMCVENELKRPLPSRSWNETKRIPSIIRSRK